jgi:hypothetical protein
MIRDQKRIDGFLAGLRRFVDTRCIPAEALVEEKNDIARNLARQEKERSCTS